MATGFCPYLLTHINEIAKSSNPMYKVRPTGFLGMLLTDNSPNSIKVDAGNGHQKTVNIKYKKRFRRADTDTSRSCDQVLRPAWVETTASLNKFRQLAIQIDDETIAQYCEDASKMIKNGTPATDFMNEFYESEILQGANALLDAVNFDVVNIQKSAFGKEIVSGNATAATPVTVNFNDDATSNSFAEGIGKILTDFKLNEGSGKPIIVGAGHFLSYQMQQSYKGLNNVGIDTKIATPLYDFFLDKGAADEWGSNDIGVFEKDSVQLIQYNRNRGFKAGQKGNSVFGIIPIPMMTERGVVPVLFDYQFKYYDCPQTLTDAYSGDSISVDRGWQLIVSKDFGLFNIPTDAYQTGDPLYQNNGTYRYRLTNS